MKIRRQEKTSDGKSNYRPCSTRNLEATGAAEQNLRPFSRKDCFVRVPNLGIVYSCFEKGCPTKPYATMPQGIMGNVGLWYLIEALGVLAT